MILGSFFFSEEFLYVKRDCKDVQEEKMSLKGENELTLVFKCCDLEKSA